MRPILLGMNNPLSPHPRHALYPDPPGCAGWRLWRMLEERTGATPDQYLAAFDRRNLLNLRAWSVAQAREAVPAFLGSLKYGGTVVVLGQEVRRALKLEPVLIHPQRAYDYTWRVIPHPSGRNLWYNRPENRLVVSVLLEELYAL